MLIKSVKRTIVSGLSAIILSMTLLSTIALAEDNGLNGIGVDQATQTQVAPPATETPPPSVYVESSSAQAVGGLFSNVGMDAEASAKANEYMHPIAKAANLIFAIILSFAFIAMFVITALDLLYIAVPPVRSILYKGGAQASGGGGMGMGGMGGMGGGFGGGMGGGMAQPQQSSIQLISDEAVAAVQASQPQQGGGMMGGFGGGASQPTSTKSVIASYMKKRTIFLVLFGVCAVLLSTTIFTDIGVSVGSWALNRLTGVNENIPA